MTYLLLSDLITGMKTKAAEMASIRRIGPSIRGAEIRTM